LLILHVRGASFTWASITGCRFSPPLAIYNPMGYMRFMQTVAETPTFTRQAEDLFDEDEKQELITFLSLNPLVGNVIAGTGGVRKVRFAASGRGKRGGARVIYYYLDEAMPLYALLVYAKNEKTDLTQDDKRAAATLVAALKAARKKS
jgi:mRNA-degrading endonuclease RelE of RelBE toxin-antitoxin system